MPEAEKGAILNARIFGLSLRPIVCCTSQNTWKPPPVPNAKSSTGSTTRSLEESIGASVPKASARHQEANLCIGFAIYGLSEYHRATGDSEALEYAIRLFHDIEAHSFDRKKNGYCEALTREWEEMADMRLSDKDANERKTMNTHLHILEPYTNLFRVWKDDYLKRQLHNLVRLFIDRILDTETSHLQLFFNDDWESHTASSTYRTRH